MSKQFHVLLVMLLFTAFEKEAVAQRLMNMPLKYVNEPDGQIIPDHSKTDVVDKELWVVASDRDDNRTYESPGGTVKKSMNFMDLFYVAGEQGEFLRLVKYDFLAKDSRNRMTKTAEEWGWARKDRLLLWPSCLINTLKLSRKALPIISSKNLYDPKSYLNDNNNLRIYENPELTKESKTSIKLFQFLFIFKELDNAILVGRTARTQSGSMQHDILGWVNKSIVKLWNDRVCLQPNPDPDAVAERKARNVAASLWASKSDASAWAKTGIGPREALWDRDNYGGTLESHQKRYPVFSNENGIIESGFVTDILDEKGIDVAKVEEAARVAKEGNELIEQIRQINMIFVVDAGVEMTEYVNMTSDIIQRMADRAKEQEKNTVKFGAVVYRDSADASCGNGNASVAKRDLTSNTSDIVGFLGNQAAIKGCKTGNKAVNQALVQAMYMLGKPRRNQTNFVILLCGAQGRDEYSRQYGDEVVQRLIGESRAYFCLFQVNQGKTYDYQGVTLRYNRVFRDACQTTYNLDKEKASTFYKAPASAPANVKFAPLPYGNFYYPVYPETSPLIGLIGFSSLGSSMSTDEVFSSLDSLFKFSMIDVERKAEAIVSIILGVESQAYKLDPSLLRYFNQMQESLDNKKLLKIYMGKKFQFFVPAYTSVSVSGLKAPVYSRVIFASQDEYNDLISNMNKLQGDLTISETRKRIKQSYIDQLTVYLGDKLARQEIEKGMEVGTMLEKYITGIKPQSELMKMKIKDLENSKIVSDEDLARILSTIRRSFTQLKQVVGDQEMIMKGELGIYFWIPEEYFP